MHNVTKIYTDPSRVSVYIKDGETDLFYMKKISVVERHGVTMNWGVIVDCSVVLHVCTHRERHRPQLQVVYKVSLSLSALSDQR